MRDEGWGVSGEGWGVRGEGVKVGEDGAEYFNTHSIQICVVMDAPNSIFTAVRQNPWILQSDNLAEDTMTEWRTRGQSAR